MGSKRDYLCWLECEGEFTALDRRGAVHTWSTVTGMKQGGETEEAREAAKESAAHYGRGEVADAARAAAIATLHDAYDLYEQGPKDATYQEGDYNMLHAPRLPGAGPCAESVGDYDYVSYSLLVERDKGGASNVWAEEAADL